MPSGSAMKIPQPKAMHCVAVFEENLIRALSKIVDVQSPNTRDVQNRSPPRLQALEKKEQNAVAFYYAEKF
jgi:hypothetical protein